MQRLILIFFVSVLMVGCSGSRGCGCPSWGYNELPDKVDIALVAIEEGPDQYVWN